MNMYALITTCPCCGDVDLTPDFGMELKEDKYTSVECAECHIPEHDAHVLQWQYPHIFEDTVPF